MYKTLRTFLREEKYSSQVFCEKGEKMSKQKNPDKIFSGVKNVRKPKNVRKDLARNYANDRTTNFGENEKYSPRADEEGIESIVYGYSGVQCV